MFNDRYGLTEAVLSGRKTQTRRIYKTPANAYGGLVVENGSIISFDANGNEIVTRPKYKVGEVAAIAQCYKDFGAYCIDSRAMTNKMFVKAEYMPHHIRITNVHVERLQDISDEDCIKEGIETMESYVIRTDGTKKTLNYYRLAYRCKSGRVLNLSGSTPREVYAALIDRISGKGTWEANPYVFVYDFELVD